MYKVSRDTDNKLCMEMSTVIREVHKDYLDVAN